MKNVFCVELYVKAVCSIGSNQVANLTRLPQVANLTTLLLLVRTLSLHWNFFGNYGLDGLIQTQGKVERVKESAGNMSRRAEAYGPRNFGGADDLPDSRRGRECLRGVRGHPPRENFEM